MKSIYVDWSKEFQYSDDPKWEFVGRELLSDKEYEDDPDDGLPMMNFAYPLYCEPSEKQIRDVVRNTSCTVVYNNEDGSYYLALTGGGMDLSQSICLAYMKTDGRIPDEYAYEMYKTGPFSVSEEDFIMLMKECAKTLDTSSQLYRNQVFNISKILKEKLWKK